jgi:hypothetical protein
VIPHIVDAKIIQVRDVRVAIVETRPSRLRPGKSVYDVSINSHPIRRGVSAAVARTLYDAIVAAVESEA